MKNDPTSHKYKLIQKSVYIEYRMISKIMEIRTIYGEAERSNNEVCFWWQSHPRGATFWAVFFKNYIRNARKTDVPREIYNYVLFGENVKRNNGFLP